MSVLIAGDGRMGRALYQFIGTSEPCILNPITAPLPTGDFHTILGALPGALGEKTLDYALQHAVDLIDIADIDQIRYEPYRKTIEAQGMRVVPDCGFSPGLINFLLGYELSQTIGAVSVEILAGSLTPRSNCFPFLWCFEDLVLEFQMHSEQLVDGSVYRRPPFAELQSERLFGLPAEHYLCASGFENLFDQSQIKDCTYRVFNPAGFRDFFLALQAHGFFQSERMNQTRSMLEDAQFANLTGGIVRIRDDRGVCEWRMQTYSEAEEPLNSMQKMTALFAVSVYRSIRKLQLPPGLYFAEELGRDARIVQTVLSELRGSEIRLERVEL